MSLPVTKRPSTAFYSSDLFGLGIGYVMVCRFKATGACEAGVFLVDVFCLGAKNAFFTKIERLDFDDLIHKIFPGPPTEISPECGRKLVEDAVAYAARFGFAPHADYKQACRVFGGIRAEECFCDFVFGQDGKPLYVNGPNESQRQIDIIMAKLEKHAGSEEFNYLLGVPEGETMPKD